MVASLEELSRRYTVLILSENEGNNPVRPRFWESIAERSTATWNLPLKK